MKNIEFNRTKEDNLEQRRNYFHSLSLEDCFMRLKAMGVYYRYDQYVDLLMHEADLEVIERNIITSFRLNHKKMNYELGGLHVDLVLVMLEKIAATMKVKASDFTALGIKCKYIVKEKNWDKQHLLDCFNLCEQVLMIIQYFKINHSQDIDDLLGCDVQRLFEHYRTISQQFIITSVFQDVLFYEGFMDEVLSCLDDYCEQVIIQYRIQIADFYYYFNKIKKAKYDYKLLAIDYPNNQEVLKRMNF